MMQSNSLTDNSTTNIEVSLTNYDVNGAMTYMIIVILWYSIGIAFLLAMDILAHSEEIEDSARRRARFLIRNLRDHTNTQEILEELVDKQKRNRLWNIYLGTAWNTKDVLARGETLRIRHMEKQLATMKRNHRKTHDTLYPSTDDTRYIRSRSDYRPQVAQLSSEATATLRRRSSLDQQTLERWKELTNLSKPCEQLPWAMRKLMIGGYPRRSTKKSLLSASQDLNTTIPTTDNEQSDLISFPNQYPKLPHGRTESDLSTITFSSNERQNPYTSYFYIPSSHPINLTLEFRPTE